MNENEQLDELASSLSLSLFFSQAVMALDDFLTTGLKPESLNYFCEIAKNTFCVGESGKKTFDPSSSGLLASPEQFRLLPEAIMHVSQGKQPEKDFINQLGSDLEEVHDADDAKAEATRAALQRLQVFFDAFGDLAIDETRSETFANQTEAEEATWMMPSLIG